MREVLAVLFLAGIVVAAHAHEIGFSSLEIMLREEAIDARVTAHIEDLAAAQRAGVIVDAAHALELRADGRTVEPQEPGQRREDATSLSFAVRFPRSGAREFAIRSVFFDGLPAGHRQLCTAKMPDGRMLSSRLLTKESGWVTLPVPESAMRAQPSHGGATRLKYVGIVAAFATVAVAAWWLTSRAVAG